MKSKKEQKKANKYNLEMFEVAKLKNLKLVVGGSIKEYDDPIDTNHKKDDSSVRCRPN